MPVKIALPKGRLLAETANLLQSAGWDLDDYHKEARSYRLKSKSFQNYLVKVFQEKDVPIQVAVGNYDLGICGLDWVEELMVKYPASALVKVKNLVYGEGVLYLAESRSAISTFDKMRGGNGTVRIASEYPNLAESFALNQRLRRFSIFPLWGAVEVYPPENAELVLVSAGSDEELLTCDLKPLRRILDFSACLIANRDSWEKKDLSEVLSTIDNRVLTGEKPTRSVAASTIRETNIKRPGGEAAGDELRLALPDGHQQLPTFDLLKKAGIHIDDYPSASGNRRPTANLDGVTIKVIRPQDMPLQVANGNFDLAISGRDWLRDHLYQFPSSPVTELLDLKTGWVKLVAVVSPELPATDITTLRQFVVKQSASLRVASEYVNIADKYARDNHLGTYRIIPTWGASEAFLPEDADLLIENTQTGRTIARHNLRIIDTLFESTACLMGNSESVLSPQKSGRIKTIVDALRVALEGSN